MSALILVCAIAASALAAGLLGSAIAERLAENSSTARGQALTPQQALGDPTLCFALCAAVATVLCFALSPVLVPVGVVVAAVVSRKLPKAFEEKQKARVRESCEARLDTLADIVALGAQAGLSFDAAVRLYCERFDNELSRRMRKALDQWTHGIRTREEALMRMAADLQSPPVRRFAETSVHALRHGAPLAAMLQQLAQELRRDRKTQLDRKVARAPIKMLVPTGVCILPAMLLLVMGPMMLQFLES